MLPKNRRLEQNPWPSITYWLRADLQGVDSSPLISVSESPCSGQTVWTFSLSAFASGFLIHTQVYLFLICELCLRFPDLVVALPAEVKIGFFSLNSFHSQILWERNKNNFRYCLGVVYLLWPSHLFKLDSPGT